MAAVVAGDLADPGGRRGAAGFLWWENRRLARGAAALVDPAMLRNPTLRGGLTAFFFQYLLQAGLFFAVPLFRSVALGLSAIATGVRLLPLSLTLLLAAVGIPKAFPDVPAKTADAIVAENADARIAGLRSSLSLLAVIALIALFFSRRIPTRQPSAAPASEPAA